MDKKVGGYRIGTYIRVSTEEQAQNLEGSIKNQEERLKNHVRMKNMEGGFFGEIKDTFIDRAKSGKDTNRPELQRMLRAIRDKEIDLVLVSELSRISRSMKDFSEIWELMREVGCSFQSLRENFDTTTAAGEMVIFTCANISQFERRQVSERVTANMNARAKRGLYNGGTVPFGYDLTPGKPGYLRIKESQAEVVRAAYDAFLKHETLSATAKWLNDNGYRLEKITRGGGRHARLDFFIVDNLHHILTSQTYIGLRHYKEGGKTKVTKAVWEPIIEQTTFDKVQKVLKNNRSKKKPFTAKRHPYLLTGITYCGKCGDSLSGKSAHGKNKKIPYYEHSWSTKKNSSLSKTVFDCGNPRRFLASKLEKLVEEEVTKLLTESSFSKSLLEEAKKLHGLDDGVKEVNQTKAKVYGYSGQLEALAERLTQLPKSVSAAPIFKQMEKVEVLKAESEKRLEELKIREGRRTTEPPIALKDYQKFLGGLKTLMATAPPEVKSKIIKKLIHRIEVGPSEVKIHYNVDESSLLREPMNLGSRLFLCPKSGRWIKQEESRNEKSTQVGAFDAEPNFSNSGCSKSLTYGAPTEIASEPGTYVNYVSVFTTHFLAFPSQNFRILRKLYVEKDWSPTQIQKFTGWHEASVRTAAKSLGLSKPKPVTHGDYVLRYGWRRAANGKLVKNMAQQKVLDQAVELFSQGLSFYQICKHLNRENIKTIKGNQWTSKALKIILLRERSESIINQDSKK